MYINTIKINKNTNHSMFKKIQMILYNLFGPIVSEFNTVRREKNLSLLFSKRPQARSNPTATALRTQTLLGTLG